MVVFVDDINMPATEEWGAQPPLELLRQLLERQGVYDRKRLTWVSVEDVVLCAACGPPGGGRQVRWLLQGLRHEFLCLKLLPVKQGNTSCTAMGLPFPLS